MATPIELKESLKKAADAIAKYVEDAATMTVETQMVELGAGGTPQVAARSVVKLDGDSESVVPMHKNPQTGMLEVDAMVYEMHQQNVQAAVDYRAKMLAALLGVLKGQ
jgi:hypothetical protein